ncbi:MAG: phosphoenolpyruvate synthase [Patescibacteria group bacterium]|nr:phosphoenolpyruvate synthase [Patescibacteria group bacterium]
MKKKRRFILWFKDIRAKDVSFVGGKNASLGEMYHSLTPGGIKIPNGFAVTAYAYQHFLKSNKLDRKIRLILGGLRSHDVRALAKCGEEIRRLMLDSEMPADLAHEIKTAYVKLSREYGEAFTDVAVRSSATAEDLPSASFAGQQETYLNVRGAENLVQRCKMCFASLFTNRAISYREDQGFSHMGTYLSIGVQKMVRSDLGSAGVIFTLDTESGFSDVVLVNASWGLGEYVVKGRVTPDQYYVFKPTLAKGFPAIISKIIGTKDVKLVYAKGGTRQAKMPAALRDRLVLSDADILKLARWAIRIEKYYGRPQDIEWAKDGRTGEIFIVQARPETVQSQKNKNVIYEYRLKKRGRVITAGSSIGSRIGQGRARIIRDPRDMKKFHPGEVLVTRITDPDWEPLMRIASAIVTEQGGKTSHAAIVSRELGIPCVVGTGDATKVIRSGQSVTVSCCEGETGYVYNGILAFIRRSTALKNIPRTKTKIMMNVGEPELAFEFSFLPNDGVGLAREEFIFTNFIKIHPLAILNPGKIKDAASRRAIARLTRGWPDKSEYVVAKLAEGIARIAAAFYPKPVIVRLSDFKTNEYVSLIGGKYFEPKENNPMLGWRGASRYYDQKFKQAFGLECRAIKRAREKWGLKNIIMMIPFCRTPREGERVLAEMAKSGLRRGEGGLEVYVMCEIPSNVILAREFAKIFDGFSIGSNDLTQLALGVDRDSELVSHIYDERNEAVKILIRQVIREAHRAGRKVGICGQAPSDYPEYTDFLVKEGIDSISLNPDTVLATRRRVAEMERSKGKGR